MVAMERNISSLVELAEVAAGIVHGLSPHSSGATLVTLSGELGAGKTAFAKEVARVLGVEEEVTSPTFVLEKIYELSEKNFKRLIHIDAYRLEGGQELSPLGFAEAMKDTGNLILLEWPEKVADALPAPALAISLEALDDGSRRLTYA